MQSYQDKTLLSRPASVPVWCISSTYATFVAGIKLHNYDNYDKCDSVSDEKSFSLHYKMRFWNKLLQKMSYRVAIFLNCCLCEKQCTNSSNRWLFQSITFQECKTRITALDRQTHLLQTVSNFCLPISVLRNSCWLCNFYGLKRDLAPPVKVIL